MKAALKNIPAIAVVLRDIDVLSVEKEEVSQADLVELRIDLFENIDHIEHIFKEAKKKFNLPLLATIRNPSEGGKREFKNRGEIYKRVLPYIDFVDLEIFSGDTLSIKELVKEQDKILITSYHRFDSTPSIGDLEDVFTKGQRLGGDIVKIATMVKNSSDLETLLLFTLKHKRDNIVVIGMGERGVPSRIINPIFGSLITYAALRESSAPGQINLKDLVTIFKTLGIRR